MKHTISVLVKNEFGVLSRISGLFSGRGYNIESLCVAETLDPEYSQMTIVTRGDDKVVEQINKQLNKLVSTVKVLDLTGEDYLDRELALVKIKVTEKNRAEVLSIIEIFRAKVVDVGTSSYTIEMTGDSKKIKAIVDLLAPFGIKEFVRTGRVAMQRSNKTKD